MSSIVARTLLGLAGCEHVCEPFLKNLESAQLLLRADKNPGGVLRLLTPDDLTRAHGYAANDVGLLDALVEAYIAAGLAAGMSDGVNIVEAAEPYFANAATVCEQIGATKCRPERYQRMLALLLAARGQVMRLAGRYDEAVALLSDAESLFERAGLRGLAACCVILQASIQLRDADCYNPPSSELLANLNTALGTLQPPEGQSFPYPEAQQWVLAGNFWMALALYASNQRDKAINHVRQLHELAGYVTIDGRDMHIVYEELTPDRRGLVRLVGCGDQPHPVLCSIGTTLA